MFKFIYNNILISAIALILTMLFIPQISASDIDNPQSGVSKSAKDERLHVTSDSMLVEKESSTITFSGNVVATQGDSVIKADTIMVLLYTDKEKKVAHSNIKQEVKSLTASGNVNLTSANRNALAEKAVYTSIDQKIVLTGASNFPRVTTGESYITGKTITLFQNSGKVIVEGGKEQRVEALFNSKEDFRQE